MARNVKTVVDVILAEAVSGNRDDRFFDMLGIASVISNRAQATGVDADSVVSAEDQFSSYGNAFPDGVQAYRELAEQAWEQIQATGPITNATYFATPAAVGNLPSDLEVV